MPDTAEVCGCNGVCKGTIVKAIKEKGLFTLDDVRKHTKASSSCGSCTGLVEQILASTMGGAYTCRQQPQGDMRLHRSEPRRGAPPRSASASCSRHPERLCALAWRARTAVRFCRPALNYYLISTWPHEAEDDPQAASSTSARTPTSRRTARSRWCRACGAA
jgi:nitrite reductase (NADH) large subunit